MAEARIKRLASLTSDLIRIYLSEDKFNVAREETEQLIEVAKANQKAPANPMAAPEPKAAPEPNRAPEPKAEPAPKRKQPF